METLLEMLRPLHPKLVHFPIALVVSAMGLQGFGLFFKKDLLKQSAWVMFHLAVLSTPVVILSGLSEAQSLHLNHPVLTAHKKFGFLVLWISLAALPVLWLIRMKRIRIFEILFLIVLIILSIFLGLTAHQGGRMVYEYGVGVSQ